jgi:hypothetical protein
MKFKKGGSKMDNYFILTPFTQEVLGSTYINPEDVHEDGTFNENAQAEIDKLRAWVDSQSISISLKK